MLEAVTTTVNDREAAETATEFRVCAFSHPLLTPTTHEPANDFCAGPASADKEAKPTPPVSLTAATDRDRSRHPGHPYGTAPNTGDTRWPLPLFTAPSPAGARSSPAARTQPSHSTRRVVHLVCPGRAPLLRVCFLHSSKKSSGAPERWRPYATNGRLLAPWKKIRPGFLLRWPGGHTELAWSLLSGYPSRPRRPSGGGHTPRARSLPRPRRRRSHHDDRGRPQPPDPADRKAVICFEAVVSVAPDSPGPTKAGLICFPPRQWTLRGAVSPPQIYRSVAVPRL